MADAAADKATFFEHLYALADSSDKEEDLNDTRLFFVSSLSEPIVDSFTSSCSSQIIDVVRTPLPAQKERLLRTISEPTPGSGKNAIVRDTPPITRSSLLKQNLCTKTLLANELSFIEDTPIRRPELTRPMSSPMPTNTSKSPSQRSKATTLGKRKRKGELSFVAEGQRIFRGLNFFYLPNDDVAPARKIRITKAREHGANWIRSFTDEVTHVIVDRKLSHKDILTYLKVSALPRHIILINDDYPTECIQFKALLDPTQKHYQVTGFDPAVQEPDQVPPNSVEPSNRSLQLKPTQSKSGKWDLVPVNTPPRSEESSQIQAIKQVQKTSLESSSGVSMEPLSDKVNDQLPVTADTTSYGEEPQIPTVQLKAKATSDDLDNAIEQVRKIQHLPLSDDEDVEFQHNEIVDSYEDERPDERSPVPMKKWAKKASFTTGKWQENFSCMKGRIGEASSTNPNARTIEILQEMATHYDQVKDNWRTTAYRKAITTLRKHPKKITTAAEAFNLPFIGHRLANKIEEIVTTDRLRRLEEAKLDPSEQIVKLFMGIYGVGHSQATKWMQQGYKTLPDLLSNVSLTQNQKIGIEYYTDFATRIPRAEVTALGNFVTKVAHELDPELQIIIGGSYRRGAQDSSDIDFIVTKANANISTLNTLFNTLVSNLVASKFLVAALAVSRSQKGSKWHGACVLPPPTTRLDSMAPHIWRRIDFLLVPASELGAALLYFTGNDIFNRSMRLLASRKGMRLNQRGLYREVMRGPGMVKINEGELVEGRDERRIFEVLGVPWREPWERIC